MATIEEKKRMAGTKVSAIANIFQSKPQTETLNHRSNGTFNDELKESLVLLKESSMQVTVVRTESHVARFNTARALFEKLGEENKLNHPMERINKSVNVQGLQSRTSSANSSSGCISPAQSSQNQVSMGSKGHCNNWSVSVPTLNVEHHFDNDQLQFANECNKFSHNTDSVKFEKNYMKENQSDNGFERTEQPEKKLSSKELIEKQKNWTSHFCKTKTNRCSSDPNKCLIQSTLNENMDKIRDTENLSDTLQQSFALVNDIVLTRYLRDDVTVPAVRSASFCSMKPPSRMFTSPPPPIPVRNSSTVELINERLMNNACVSSKHIECDTVNKMDISNIIPNNAKFLEEQNLINNTNREIPEYATVQKNITTKTKVSIPNSMNSPSSKINELEFHDLSENNSINYELSQLKQIPSKNYLIDNKESLLSENSNYEISCVKSPAKTLKYSNESLTEHAEILNSVSELGGFSKTTYTDFDKSDNKKSQWSDCKFRKFCGKNDSKLSNTYSSSSSFEDTKTKKVDKEVLEKLKTE